MHSRATDRRSASECQGNWPDQTLDQAFGFKMVLRRAGMKYEDLTIKNIWSQFGLAPALKEGKVDAVVSWEPYVTAVA